MSVSEYPWETIAFSLDHNEWCPSLPSLVSCSQRTDHTVTIVNMAMLWIPCPVPHETRHGSPTDKPVYPLQTLPSSHWTGWDRNIHVDIHMYTHMLMTWPHFPCPSPYHSTVPWTCTCTTDMAVPPVLWCPSHVGEEETVQWTYTHVPQ